MAFLLHGLLVGVPLQPEHVFPEGRGALEQHFDSVTEGPGVWKWKHYFEAYESHLAKFRGTDVVIAEVGIYSGGSLRMWREYFGPKATIIGIDIAPETRKYIGQPEYGSPQIFVGNQGNASFWAEFRKAVPRLDVLIDDGGHTMPLQETTLSQMWPHISPGGVYICEDLHHPENPFPTYVFNTYVRGSTGFNAMWPIQQTGPREGELTLHADTTNVNERELAKVTFYTFLVVMDKRAHTIKRVEAPQHGTVWQPRDFFVRAGAVGTSVGGDMGGARKQAKPRPVPLATASVESNGDATPPMERPSVDASMEDDWVQVAHN